MKFPLYAVRVHYAPAYDGCPRDAFFGYEPVVYVTPEDAQARADDLGKTGDWGEVDPPSYYVAEVADAADLTPAEHDDYEEMADEEEG